MIDDTKQTDLKKQLINFKKDLLIHKEKINNADFIIDNENLNIAYIPLRVNKIKQQQNNVNGFLSIFGIVSLITAVIVILIGLGLLLIKG